MSSLTIPMIRSAPRTCFSPIEGFQLLCNKSTVLVGDEKHVIYTFREVDQLQKLEQKVRIKMYEKGHVARHTF